MNPRTTPYAVLGVSPDASDAEIAAAYRRLARRWHPDRNPGSREAEDRAKAINVAYSELKTPEARERTDLRLRQERAAAAWRRTSHSPPTAPRNLFELAQVLTSEMPPRGALRVQLAACLGDLVIDFLKTR